MIILDRLLIGGIAFVLDKVAQAVEREMNDEEHMREELLAAYARLETGELSPEKFKELEADLLARIRTIREAKQGGSGGAIEMGSGGGVQVDATVEGDEGEVE